MAAPAQVYKGIVKQVSIVDKVSIHILKGDSKEKVKARVKNLKKRHLRLTFVNPYGQTHVCRNIDHDDQRVDAFKNIFCC